MIENLLYLFFTFSSNSTL